MRKSALAVAALAAFLCGCDMVSFDVSQDIPSLTLGPTTPLPGSFQAAAITPQSTATATRASLQKLSLTAVSGGDFSFLSNLEVFVSTEGQPKIEIAQVTEIPAGQTTLSLDVYPGINLLTYLQNGCTVTIQANGSAPSEPFSFSGSLDVEVGF